MTSKVSAFTVKAKVLVNSPYNYNLDLEIEGWKVIPYSGGREYVKTFLRGSNRKDWIQSIEDLRFILLACFLDDLSPKVIEKFEVDGGFTEDDLKLPLPIHIFGTSGINSSETFFSGSFFNTFSDYDPNIYQPDIDSINKWFRIFKKNIDLAINLTLIQQSFVLINKSYLNNSYFDPTNLLNGIIFLVSGLEGIFLENQKSERGVSTKFLNTGVAYYSKYSKEDFIKRFQRKPKKFSDTEFHNILKELYHLRSCIAHGDYNKLNKCETWKNILELGNVYYEDNYDIEITLRSVSAALSLLQKHILSIIIGAEENLSKGIKILNVKP